MSFLPEHVISQLGEERLLNEIGVVGLEEFLGGLLGLHGGQLVSLGFESADNVTDDSTLNTIGLDLLSIEGRNKLDVRICGHNGIQYVILTLVL